MLNSILNFTETTAMTFTTYDVLICTLASVVFGLIAAGIYMFRNNYNKNFVITLALLPAIIQLIIMMVNGNIGTGIAVMGAFSLVRFRSVPGSSRDIGAIFLAMALGLATRMGYVPLAAVFLVVIGLCTVLLLVSPFGSPKDGFKELKITIPEDLDYNGIFDDLFEKYTNEAELQRVRVTNMGSLYELRYKIMLKNEENEKQFIDDLRCRNGNLNIVCGRISDNHNEL